LFAAASIGSHSSTVSADFSGSNPSLDGEGDRDASYGSELVKTCRSHIHVYGDVCGDHGDRLQVVVVPTIQAQASCIRQDIPLHEQGLRVARPAVEGLIPRLRGRPLVY